jgi:hypothetical protein
MRQQSPPSRHGDLVATIICAVIAMAIIAAIVLARQ